MVSIEISPKSACLDAPLAITLTYSTGEILSDTSGETWEFQYLVDFLHERKAITLGEATSTEDGGITTVQLEVRSTCQPQVPSGTEQNYQRVLLHCLSVLLCALLGPLHSHGRHSTGSLRQCGYGYCSAIAAPTGRGRTSTPGGSSGLHCHCRQQRSLRENSSDGVMSLERARK